MVVVLRGGGCWCGYGRGSGSWPRRVPAESGGSVGFGLVVGRGASARRMLLPLVGGRMASGGAKEGAVVGKVGGESVCDTSAGSASPAATASAPGKSTLACALSRELHSRGFLSYVLDGDNVRHGLNRDLSFKQEDRAENIRRIGEVAKLFADAGIICIASLISPYRRDRDGCRTILPEGTFIEVFMSMPLEVCEARDSKGLYKLARAGKIKGFTGIDDPYEPPLTCEITILQKDGICPSPTAMAKQVVAYLQDRGFLQA